MKLRSASWWDCRPATNNTPPECLRRRTKGSTWRVPAGVRRALNCRADGSRPMTSSRAQRPATPVRRMAGPDLSNPYAFTGVWA